MAGIYERLIMITQLRDNIFIADQAVTGKDLLDNGITVILVVAVDAKLSILEYGLQYFAVPLSGVNKTHVKDIACHIPKYMTQFGEKVCIISKTGKVRAAYVAARAICELEQTSIYEVFIELQEKIEGFDIGKAYL